MDKIKHQLEVINTRATVEAKRFADMLKDGECVPIKSLLAQSERMAIIAKMQAYIIKEYVTQYDDAIIRKPGPIVTNKKGNIITLDFCHRH